MLSGSVRTLLWKEVDPETFRLRTDSPVPWNQQLGQICFSFCVLCCFFLIAFQAVLSFDFRPEHSLTDYGSLYASASLANLHVDPYRNHPLVFHLRDLDRHGNDTRLQGSIVNAINLNPPILLYPFRVLARLTPDASFVAWSCISGALFIASVLLVVRTYPEERLRIRLLWILSLGAVWYTFKLGQIYTILLLFGSLAWWALRKQKWLVAGISIGMICAIKPNFLIWPGLLIAGKSKKTGFTAFATTAIVSAIPLALQGPIAYRRWLAAARGFNGYELPGNSSLLAMFSRAGIPGVGIALTVLMLAAVTIWMFVSKPEPLFNSEIGILASLFAGPISWVGYSILLIPVLYGKSMNKMTRIGSILLCIPVWVAVPGATTSRLTYIFLWAPHFYALVLLAISAVRSGAYNEVSASVPAETVEGRPLIPGSNPEPQRDEWKLGTCVAVNE